MNNILLIEDGELLVLRTLTSTCIELFDNRYKSRSYASNEVDRPGLKRFSKNRVIGVGAGVLNCIYRAIKINAARDKLTNELRDDHGRVRIIDMHRNVFIELRGRLIIEIHVVQDELRACAYHKVFLVDAKQATCLVGVVRIEEGGHAVLNI